MAQDITYNDIKAAVQGLDPASAVEVAQIAQLAVKKAGAEGKNFDGSPSTSGAVFVPSARRMVELIEGAKGANPRELAPIECFELAHSETVYHANSAALQTAFPAASNGGKAGYVGTAASYQIFVSDGTSWAARTGIVAFRVSPSTSGYTETQDLPDLYGLTGTGPDFGGVLMNGKHRFIGGLPVRAASTGINTSYQNRPGATVEKRKGFLHFKTSDTRPLIRILAQGGKIGIKVRSPQGWRYLSNAAIQAVQTSGITYHYALTAASGGGWIPHMLDFSALGYESPEVAVHVAKDAALQRTAIRNAHVYYPIPRPALRGAILTDSLGDTVPSGDGNESHCYPDILRDYMGDVDLLIINEAGTGFVANATTQRTHLEKLQYLASVGQYSNDLDFIWIAHSVNDSDVNTLTPAVDACVQYARATWPKALIIVAGSTAQNNTTNQALQTTLSAAVAATVAGQTGVVYVPTMDAIAGPPITGTGGLPTTTGNGSSDRIYNNSDGTHFNGFGHWFWARDVLIPNVLSALRTFVARA